MKQIGGWIRNPANNILKGQSKRTALFILSCEKPEQCDLLQKEETCLLCNAMTPCRFGQKTGKEGPTPRAKNYFSVIDRWKKEHGHLFGKIKKKPATGRIFKVGSLFHLPYDRMVKRVFGSGFPLSDAWIDESQLTTEMLDHICDARPKAEFGGELRDYQMTTVPKFLTDLRQNYPDIFDRLSDRQKARLGSVSHIGRRADITTCPPGDYKFGTSTWHWDGVSLTADSILMPPAPGKIEVKVTPEKGAPVIIASDDQVTPSTRFLD